MIATSMEHIEAKRVLAVHQTGRQDPSRGWPSSARVRHAAHEVEDQFGDLVAGAL
jgi:hypothetical protein